MKVGSSASKVGEGKGLDTNTVLVTYGICILKRSFLWLKSYSQVSKMISIFVWDKEFFAVIIREFSIFIF